VHKDCGVTRSSPVLWSILVAAIATAGSQSGLLTPPQEQHCALVSTKAIHFHILFDEQLDVQISLAFCIAKSVSQCRNLLKLQRCLRISLRICLRTVIHCTSSDRYMDDISFSLHVVPMASARIAVSQSDLCPLCRGLSATTISMVRNTSIFLSSPRRWSKRSRVELHGHKCDYWQAMHRTM
jgi:hypothetical protein